MCMDRKEYGKSVMQNDSTAIYKDTYGIRSGDRKKCPSASGDESGSHRLPAPRPLSFQESPQKTARQAGVSSSLGGGLYHQCGGCPSNDKSGFLPRLPLFRLKEVGSILGGLCPGNAIMGSKHVNEVLQ